MFADEVNLEAYRALSAAPTLHDAVSATDPTAADLLQRLAVEDTEADPTDVLALLVNEAAKRELAVMRAEVGTADEALVFERSTEMAWVKLRMEELHETDTAAAAVEQLQEWLLRRRQDDPD